MKISLLSVMLAVFTTVSGSTLQLNTSAPYAVLGKQFKFVCTATWPYNYKRNYKICFTERSITLHQCFRQMADRCLPIKTHFKKINCGEGTDSPSALIKVYTLSFVAAPEYNNTLWDCQIQGVKASNTFMLESRVELVSFAALPPVAVIGYHVSLTCTVRNYYPIDETVIFHRNKLYSVFASLYQKDDQCVVKKKPPSKNYQLLCGKGTDRKWSDIKIYILQVRELDMHDQAKWWCQLLPDGTNSNKLSLKIHNKPVMSIDCKSPGQLGKLTELSCTRTTDYPSVISWIRPDLKYAAWCNQSISRCWVPAAFKKQYLASVQSVSQFKLVIKSFERRADVGTWQCQDEVYDTGDSCNKSQGIGQDKSILHESKSFAATFITCMGPDSGGMKAELLCTTKEEALAAGILWTSPDGSKVVQCNVLSTGCITNARFAGQYVGFVDSSSKYRLVIQAFSPQSDAGIWACSDGVHGPKSSCMKATKYISLNLTASSTYANEGMRVIFKCIVHNASNTDDVMEFYRGRSIIGALYQKGDQCGASGNTISENYHVQCGTYTNDKESNMKKYKLLIQHTLVEDDNFWWCQLKLHGIQSNRWRLVISASKKSKFIMNPGAIAGIAVSSIIAVAIIILFLVYWSSKWGKRGIGEDGQYYYYYDDDSASSETDLTFQWLEALEHSSPALTNRMRLQEKGPSRNVPLPPSNLSRQMQPGPNSASTRMPFQANSQARFMSIPPTSPSTRPRFPPTNPSARMPFAPNSPSARMRFPPTNPSARMPLAPNSPSARMRFPPMSPSMRMRYPPNYPRRMPMPPSALKQYIPTGPAKLVPLPQNGPSKSETPNDPSKTAPLPPDNGSSQNAPPPPNNGSSQPVLPTNPTNDPSQLVSLPSNSDSVGVPHLSREGSLQGSQGSNDHLEQMALAPVIPAKRVSFAPNDRLVRVLLVARDPNKRMQFGSRRRPKRPPPRRPRKR